MTGCPYTWHSSGTLAVCTSVRPTGSLINKNFCALAIKNSLTNRKVLEQTCVTIKKWSLVLIRTATFYKGKVAYCIVLRHRNMFDNFRHHRTHTPTSD